MWMTHFHYDIVNAKMNYINGHADLNNAEKGKITVFQKITLIPTNVKLPSVHCSHRSTRDVTHETFTINMSCTEHNNKKKTYKHKIILLCHIIAEGAVHYKKTLLHHSHFFLYKHTTHRFNVASNEMCNNPYQRNRLLSKTHLKIDSFT